MTGRRDSWTGCHGVRLSGEALEVGRATGEPLADALVEVGSVPSPAGAELWRLHVETEARGERRTVDRWLCRHEGSAVIHASAGPALSVDLDTNLVTIEPGPAPITVQLISSFAVPLVVNGLDALVMHASTIAKDGRSLVVCGRTGAGKSSVLVRMLDAGWLAVSEDVCAIDLRGDVPVAWPGPPWVRRAYGEPGPAGAGMRFETPDKAAWDIGPWQTEEAVPVASLVFLDAPGGDEPRWEALDQPAAVRDVAQHTAWLRDPIDAPRHLFGRALALTGRVPSHHLRLPRDPSWLDAVPEVLSARL